MADISTLHAFCADALRSYFYVLGLEPNFSVAEDSVAQELKNDAFDRVAESELNAEDEVYLRLVEMLGKKSEQTSFKQTVFRLYDFFVCRPDFDGWFEEKRKYYFAEGEDNPFLSALGDELKKGRLPLRARRKRLRARRLNAMRRQPLNMRRRLPPVPVCRRERVFSLISKDCRRRSFPSFQKR